MIIRIAIFLIVNFIALGLGGLFTGKGVSSEWYANLNKAPWTPPGWTFGLVWTLIMICLAVYMSRLWEVSENKKLLIGLFSLQWVLNVLWNPVFFHFQHVGFGLFVISVLTILIGCMLYYYWSKINLASILLLPYFIWLIIASSLNAYILINN